MSSGLYVWSQTAASNANADSTINWAEGMAPSAVNDSARAMMAGIAKFRDDISGATVTGGTSTAYTVASNQSFDTLAHLANQMIAFTPNATNTNTVGNDVTLNVDSLGAKPIRIQPSIPLPTGALILGTPYIVTYNNSDGAFYLQGMTNPYNVPIGSGMDFWGTTAPNTSFAFPIGQAISRTTYSALFNVVGTLYGAGDGSTTFNLPDKTGRVSAMKEASATRLTSTYFGGDSTAYGAVGGLESNTLTSTQIPAHSHPNSLNDTGHNHGVTAIKTNTFSGGGVTALTPSGNPGGLSTDSNVTGITITNANNTGGGGAHNNVQPTIICNYIMRVI